MVKKKGAKKNFVMKRGYPDITCKLCGSDSCNCDLWLCVFSSIAFAFALTGLVPVIGSFVSGVEWWVWLLLSIALGWKPLNSYLNTK